jgi:hypothetical protein
MNSMMQKTMKNLKLQNAMFSDYCASSQGLRFCSNNTFHFGAMPNICVHIMHYQ